ncbi:hypothetical protein BaRGS_00002418 [Batillaria attramentaria]|uniref:Uncharacterized protein n=1 Tax=Batillaria attramentaria TaxID=370345 RepID=A0ABD0M3H4_9CAEN
MSEKRHGAPQESITAKEVTRGYVKNKMSGPRSCVTKRFCKKSHDVPGTGSKWFSNVTRGEGAQEAMVPRGTMPAEISSTTGILFVLLMPGNLCLSPKGDSHKLGAAAASELPLIALDNGFDNYRQTRHSRALDKLHT